MQEGLGGQGVPTPPAPLLGLLPFLSFYPGCQPFALTCCLTEEAGCIFTKVRLQLRNLQKTKWLRYWQCLAPCVGADLFNSELRLTEEAGGVFF